MGMIRKITEGNTASEERQETRTSDAVRPGCPVADARIAASIKLIESGLEKGIRASDVAARLGLSASRFGHVFRTQTGLTFRQYVRAARLVRAKLLLRDMRLRVEEVAWRCGYAHTSNLDREFEREFRLSPSDYRRGTSG